MARRGSASRGRRSFRASARHAYDLADDPQVAARVPQRFFAESQFKRSALPNSPKVVSGGSLSPRGDWRAPSDGNANVWLAELEANVPLSESDARCQYALVLVDFFNPQGFEARDGARDGARRPRHGQAQGAAAPRGVPAVYANDNFGHWETEFSVLRGSVPQASRRRRARSRSSLRRSPATGRS